MTLMGNPATKGSFGGLASSALPSLGGDPLARPTWKRSLQELAASNIALMGNGSSGGGAANGSNSSSSSNHSMAAPPTAAAQMLLGSRTDFGSLLSKSSIESSKRKKNTDRIQNKGPNASSRFSYDSMSGGGIEAVVRRHRDGMLERILKDEREQTQRLLDKAVERQVEDDWKEERMWWRKELVGDRNIVDATNKDASNGYSLGSASVSAGIKQRLVGNGASNNPSQGLLVADYSGRTGIKNSMYASGCDPKAMQEHLAVVKQIQPTSDPLRIIAGFEQLACTEAFGGGYKNAWMILGCMLPNMQSPISGARGAQAHFCRQYQTIINNHIKSATLKGQDISTPVNYGGTSSMASIIASYVKLVSGSNASVWEILYYCT